MDEQYYEKLLNITTAGQQKSFPGQYLYNRYEPTAYSALEALAEQYAFSPEDGIVDFGCGKGRVSFYINHFFKSTVTGIEMNSYYYKIALDNKMNYAPANKSRRDNVYFINCLAEKYEVNTSDNKFYFFNPFSVQIFATVLKNILGSVEQCERAIDIILYYPSNDYIQYLDNKSPFTLTGEIMVPGLCDTDPRHRFLIYGTDL